MKGFTARGTERYATDKPMPKIENPVMRQPEDMYLPHKVNNNAAETSSNPIPSSSN